MAYRVVRAASHEHVQRRCRLRRDSDVTLRLLIETFVGFLFDRESIGCLASAYRKFYMGNSFSTPDPCSPSCHFEGAMAKTKTQQTCLAD